MVININLLDKLLGLTAASYVGHYGYRKATEFETNVTIEDKYARFVLTDKGIFVLQYKLRSFDFGPNFKLNELTYGPVTLEEKETYHVIGYGLDYTQFHLYRHIVFENGSPCSSTDHCGEKPSRVSHFKKKLD